MIRSKLSTSSFALLSSVFFQGVLLVSGLGTAWLVGDIGRGILAYGAVIATLAGVFASGGISSAAAVTVNSYSPEHLPSLRSHLLRLANGRSAAALLFVFIGYLVVREDITTATVPIVFGACAAAIGLLQVQIFVGIAQATDRTNIANGSRIIAPTVYALGIVAVALIFRDRGDHLVAPVAWAWALGWFIGGSYCYFQNQSEVDRSAARLSESQRKSFSKTERSHFFSSLYSYEVLRFDLLAAALILPTAELGVYSVSMSFTGLLKAMAASFGVASLGDSLGTSSYKLLLGPIAKRTGMIAAVTVPLLIAIPFAIDFMFPAEFESAINPSRLLVLAAACAAIRRTIVEAFKALGFAYIGSATEVLQFVMLFVFAMAYRGRGATGVALITLVTLAVSCCITGLWMILAARGKHQAPSEKTS